MYDLFSVISFKFPNFFPKRIFFQKMIGNGTSYDHAKITLRSCNYHEDDRCVTITDACKPLSKDQSKRSLRANLEILITSENE